MLRGLYQAAQNNLNRNIILGSKYFFAKQPKEPGGGKKDDPKAIVA